MPGHVHTLGILRHSRSRHDRHNHETFGDEENSDPGTALVVNPTGDPVLDARMVEEEEEPWPRGGSSLNRWTGLQQQQVNQLTFTFCSNLTLTY